MNESMFVASVARAKSRSSTEHSPVRVRRASAEATSTSDNRLIAAGPDASKVSTTSLPGSRTYRLTKALESKYRIRIDPPDLR